MPFTAMFPITFIILFVDSATISLPPNDDSRKKPGMGMVSIDFEMR